MRYTTIEELREAFECDGSNSCIMEDSSQVQFLNSSVSFAGEGNILFIEAGVVVRNSAIAFNGNNSVVYISKSRNACMINASVHNSCSIYIGSNNYFNGKLNIIASEHKSVVIGKDGLFSFGIWIRTADPHLLYDIESCERINDSKSILVGDHVWLGQDCMLLKGACVGSGSTVAARAVVTKAIESDSVCGGVSARVVKTGVFWKSDCTHLWDEEKTMTHREASVQTHFSAIAGVPDKPAVLDLLGEMKSADKVLELFRMLSLRDDPGRFVVRPKRKSRLFRPRG